MDAEIHETGHAYTYARRCSSASSRFSSRSRQLEHQLFVKLKKCSFAQSEIVFVGLIVGCKGIRPVPKKLQNISDLPVPKNAKHVLTFLGLCCFYHQFSPQFANIASPPTALTGKKVWHLGATEQRAFEELKESFFYATSSSPSWAETNLTFCTPTPQTPEWELCSVRKMTRSACAS